MDYGRIYDRLVDRGKSRIPVGYAEKHHIVPRCMGGDDCVDNLVSLYPEEHFLAHVLLLKIHKNTRYRGALAKSVNMMMTVSFANEGRNSFNRKTYGWLRRELSLSMSFSQSGKRNSQHGSFWISHPNDCKDRKVRKGGEIPEGWVRGRGVWKPEKEKQKKEKTSKIKDTLNSVDLQALIKEHDGSLNSALKSLGMSNAGGYHIMAKEILQTACTSPVF